MPNTNVSNNVFGNNINTTPTGIFNYSNPALLSYSLNNNGYGLSNINNQNANILKFLSNSNPNIIGDTYNGTNLDSLSLPYPAPLLPLNLNATYPNSIIPNLPNLPQLNNTNSSQNISNQNGNNINNNTTNNNNNNSQRKVSLSISDEVKLDCNDNTNIANNNTITKIKLATLDYDDKNDDKNYDNNDDDEYEPPTRQRRNSWPYINKNDETREKERENDVLNQHLRTLKSKIDDLKSDNNSLNVKIDKLTNQNDVLKKTINNIRQSLMYYISSDISNTDDSNNKFKNVIKKLLNDFPVLNNNTQSNITNIDDMKSDICVIEDTMSVSKFDTITTNLDVPKANKKSKKNKLLPKPQINLTQINPRLSLKMLSRNDKWDSLSTTSTIKHFGTPYAASSTASGQTYITCDGVLSTISSTSINNICNTIVNDTNNNNNTNNTNNTIYDSNNIIRDKNSSTSTNAQSVMKYWKKNKNTIVKNVNNIDYHSNKLRKRRIQLMINKSKHNNPNMYNKIAKNTKFNKN